MGTFFLILFVIVVVFGVSLCLAVFGLMLNGCMNEVRARKIVENEEKWSRKREWKSKVAESEGKRIQLLATEQQRLIERQDPQPNVQPNIYYNQQ
jgi:hypothetical protein